MKDIPGFPGYFLTEDGRLYSARQGGLKERKLPVAPNGYVTLRLSRDGKQVSAYLHHLMALTFLGPGEGVVRHLDDNKLNNARVNLAYGTPRDNSLDYSRNGHHYSRRTHCKWNHEYTPENTRMKVKDNGDTSRICIACTLRRASDQRERARKKKMRNG